MRLPLAGAAAGMAAGDNSVISRAVRACSQGAIAVAVFSLAINALMLTVPLFMLQVYDRVLQSRSTDTLIALIVIAGVALVIMALLDGLRGTITATIGSWLDTKLGAPVLDSAVDDLLHGPGAPTVQGIRDLSTLRGFLSSPAFLAMLDAPAMPVFLAAIFMLHSALGWASVAGAAILFALALLNEFTTRKLLSEAGNLTIRSQAQADAAVRNADVIQAMGMMPSLLARWGQDRQAASAVTNKASGRAAKITAASKFTRLFVQMSILSIGALLVIYGEMSPGGMIAASILMSRALSPVEQSIAGWRSLVSARDAYRRLKARLSYVEADRAFTPLPRPKGALNVENLAFMYRGSDAPTLAGVNFAVKPGEALAVVGPTASGKTTLARLLVGSLSPTSGKVRLDGRSVSAWPAEDRGQYVGYLPQDVELFDGTIAQNIARMQDADPQDIIAAAQLAGVHDMIVKQSGGYDTLIGSGGTTLSGGQRQRIGLARALFRTPAFLVLDEPNSNLDQEGEAALNTAITHLKGQGATIIVIAHRAGVLQMVDNVLVLRDGRMAGYGPKDEVLAKLQGGSHAPADPAAVLAANSGAVRNTGGPRPVPLRPVPRTPGGGKG